MPSEPEQGVITYTEDTEKEEQQSIARYTSEAIGKTVPVEAVIPEPTPPLNSASSQKQDVDKSARVQHKQNWVEKLMNGINNNYRRMVLGKHTITDSEPFLREKMQATAEKEDSQVVLKAGK